MLAGSFALDAIGAGLVSLDHPLFEAEASHVPPNIRSSYFNGELSKR